MGSVCSCVTLPLCLRFLRRGARPCGRRRRGQWRGGAGLGAGAPPSAAQRAGQRHEAAGEDEQHDQQDRALQQRREVRVDGVRQLRHEHVVRAPEDRARDAPRATDHHRGDQRDRMPEAHGLRGGVLDDEHVQEPAHPADQRRDREGQHLVAVRRDAHGGRHVLVALDDRERPAEPAADEVAGQQERDAADGQHEVELPLVVEEPGSRRRLGEARRQALGSAGEIAQPLREWYADDRQRDRDHRDRQSAQAGGGEGNEQPRDRGGQAGEDEDQDDVPVVRDAVRGDVRAETQEEDLAERDLPGVAHHHVEAEHGDGVDADAGDRLVGELRQHEGQHGEHDHQQQRTCPAHPPLLPPGRGRGGHFTGHHTRTTTFRPNRPWGRTISTTKMRMNGTATFRSKPMKSMYTAARFSRTPMIQAATTTPIGLVRPPRMTAASAYTRALSSIPGVSVSCGATSMPATAPSAAARPQPTMRRRPTGRPENAADCGLFATARRARPSFVPTKSPCSRSIATMITTVVPIERMLIETPRNDTVSREKSEGNCWLLYVKSHPQMPVIRVSRPIVTTTAVSGSPRSKRRINQRSTTAPSTKEKRIDTRMARTSGTSWVVSHHATYAASTAMPPCAKLIRPVAWLTSTIASAIAP